MPILLLSQNFTNTNIFLLRSLSLITILSVPATKIFVKRKYDFFLDLIISSTQLIKRSKLHTFFFFGHAIRLAGSYFLHQGSNPGPGSESAESQTLDCQGTPYTF